MGIKTRNWTIYTFLTSSISNETLGLTVNEDEMAHYCPLIQFRSKIGNLLRTLNTRLVPIHEHKSFYNLV